MASTFQGLYRKLNIEQKKAVDAIEGPVMVMAGPGTGKTQILTLRIANILQNTDLPPDSILALTFTESGVFSMRRRLVEIIGSAGYRVNIHTFHGFCNDVIKRFPESFDRVIGSEPIADIDRVTLLRNIVSKSEWKHLKPFSNNFYFVSSILGKISDLKRENISPEELRKRAADEEKSVLSSDDLHHAKGRYSGQMKGDYIQALKRIERNGELADIFEQYEKELRAGNLYDYDDMILEVIRTLSKDKDLLLSLQEQYQYILADEHQDSNIAQNTLLELLADFHENPNLFVVGDIKQAIYRFQGASLENFQYFTKKYPGALVVKLKHSYRSGQVILDGAHALIKCADVGAEENIKLNSKSGVKNASINTRSFSGEEYEMIWLAQDIKKKINEGVELSEISVLYRTNADARKVSKALSVAGVNHVIESGQNVLEDPDIRKLISILRAVSDFGSNSYLVPVLHIGFLNLLPEDVYRVLRFARRERMPLFDILKNKKLLKAANVSDVSSVHGLYNMLRKIAEYSREHSVLETFDEIVRKSGFLTYILLSTRAGELVEKIRGLSSGIEILSSGRPDYTLGELVEHLYILEEYNIPIRKNISRDSSSRVRLMTAHKSKGLEFDYVYIIGAHDKHWGNRSSRDLFKIPGLGIAGGDDDDERRLFFVALTRARVGICISYCMENKNGKQQLPSQFIEELGADCVTVEDMDGFESKVTISDFFKEPIQVDSALENKEFLNGLFIENGLSVTALNNYLACPWRYFYRNLVRIPEVSNKHLLFGNAIHSAVYEYFEQFRKRAKVNEKYLIKMFERALIKQPFSRGELEEARNKGNSGLSSWWRNYHKNWSSNIVNELSVNVDLDIAGRQLSKILLRGKLDKIEILEDGKTVNVVDYKTGKPKSRNYIEGKTKTSNGDYKRQLVFYKLLLDLYDDGRYLMQSGEVDFIEPDEKGRLHKELFHISGEEVVELKETIERASGEIIDLNFWDKVCDDKECKYCALRGMMH